MCFFSPPEVPNSCLGTNGKQCGLGSPLDSFLIVDSVQIQPDLLLLDETL